MSNSFWHWAISKLRNQFLAGLLVLIPAAASVAVLIWVFSRVDNLLQPVIELIFGKQIIGLGFAVTLVLIYIIGVIAGNFVGKKIFQFTDSILVKLPIFRQLYTGAQQVMNTIAGNSTLNKAAFREVVLVDFPTDRMSAVAFVTNEFLDDCGKRFYAVYIPSTPVPTSGFAGLVGEDQITRTNLTVDDAIRMIISGWMLTPATFTADGINKVGGSFRSCRNQSRGSIPDGPPAS